MAEWQPIETAPEATADAPILVYSADMKSYDVAYIGWNDEAGKPVWFNGDVAIEDASHWMPLPDAPNA